jgi:hypothetical protein
MQIHVDFRAVLLIAFGSWSKVATAAGVNTTGTPSKWTHGVPSQIVPRLMAHPSRPGWLTEDMLSDGAVVTIEGVGRRPMAAE